MELHLHFTFLLRKLIVILEYYIQKKNESVIKNCSNLWTVIVIGRQIYPKERKFNKFCRLAYVPKKYMIHGQMQMIIGTPYI